MDVFDAVTLSDITSLQQLIDDDPSCVNLPDDTGLPPLYTAARYGNQPAIDTLIAGGATIDIFAACYLGRADVGRTILSQTPDAVRHTTSQNRTPLHFACQKGSFDMAVLLIAAGADVDAADSHGHTPLSEAAHGGPWKSECDSRIVSALIEAGAFVSFWLAAEIGRRDLLQQKIDAGAELNEPDELGYTAL